MARKPPILNKLAPRVTINHTKTLYLNRTALTNMRNRELFLLMENGRVVIRDLTRAEEYSKEQGGDGVYPPTNAGMSCLVSYTKDRRRGAIGVAKFMLKHGLSVEETIVEFPEVPQKGELVFTWDTA